MKLRALGLIFAFLGWPSPAQQTPSSSHNRNYQNCLYGLYGCDRTQLSAQEQEAVAVAAHNRNYQNCLYGLYGCDPNGLSTEEREHLPTGPAAVSPTTQPQQGQKDGLNNSGPACAENGSCYGDISDKPGRPKTVYVQGYYRKDGTYVGDITARHPTAKHRATHAGELQWLS